MRIGTHSLYIQVSELIGHRSTCQRAQVGCVITKNDRIISTGYNGLIRTGDDRANQKCRYCDISKPCDAVHAEQNAIYNAARLGIKLEGGILYCIFSPCQKCAEAIVQVGIRQVVYLTEYRDKKPIDFLKSMGIVIWCISESA